MTRAFGQEISAPRLIRDPSSGELYCPIDPDSDYAGPDCDTQEMLKSASLALKALESLLKLASTITDAKMKADLQKSIEDAKRKIAEGQEKMIDASNKINEATNGLAGANEQINSLVGELSSIQNSMALELANITSIAGSIAGIDARIGTASGSLAEAQARFDRALNRANYPAGSAGLQQQRADLRSANLDIFNLNSTIADLQNTRGQAVFEMNQAGDRYNNQIPQANAVRDGVQSAYDIANQYQGLRDAGANQFNEGASVVRDGYNTALDAGRAYRDFQQNVLMPMTEGATGARGLSKALNNIAEGNNFSAVSDIMNSGLESGLRNAGNATLNQFGGLWGTTVSEAGRALDQTIKSNGTVMDFFQNVAINTGNKLLGVSNFIEVGKGVENAYQFSKAGDVNGAGMELAQRITPNAIQGVMTVGQTVLPFTPLAPVTPAVSALTPAVVTAGTGVVTTLVESAQAPFSQPITRPGVTPGGLGTGPGERGLGAGQALGKPSAPTVAVAGMIITAIETARTGVSTVLGQRSDLAVGTSIKISDMAHSGTSPIQWTPSLRPGSVELRPPSAVPVGGIGTIIGGP